MVRGIREQRSLRRVHDLVVVLEVRLARIEALKVLVVLDREGASPSAVGEILTRAIERRPERLVRRGLARAAAGAACSKRHGRGGEGCGGSGSWQRTSHPRPECVR